MTTTERETVIVTGTVDSIIQKGPDKWQAVVKTPEAGQYGKKIWTKDGNAHATITALLGQVATFECGVSHYNLPDGTPTSSLWINAVNPGAPPPQEPPGAVEAVAAVAQEAAERVTTNLDGAQPPPTLTQRDSFGDPKQASIERQQALICAVAFCAIDPQSATMENALKVAEEFDKFLARSTPF